MGHFNLMPGVRLLAWHLNLTQALPPHSTLEEEDIYHIQQPCLDIPLVNNLVLLNDVVDARGTGYIRPGAPYESRSTLPTSITHPLNVHCDGNAPFHTEWAKYDGSVSIISPTFI